MARSFNGTSDQASAPGTGFPDDVTASQITFCCWFLLTASPSNEIVIFAKWSAANTGGYMFNFNQSGFASKLGGNIYITIPLNHFHDIYTSALSLNQWYVGVVVYQTNLNMQLWLGTNGVMTLIGTDNGVGTVGSMASSGGNVGFGGPNAGRSGSVYTQGLIGPCAVWNVRLTAEEVKVLASVSPDTVRNSSLVGCWPLYGASSSEPDASGNGQNATLTGTTQGNHPPCAVGNWTW